MAGLRVRVIPSVVLRMFNDFVEGESMKLDCRIGLVLGLFAILFLAACGDETTQVVQEKMSVVKTISDLPGCTSENEGSQALVKGETPVRICVDGEWVSMSELGNDTIYVDEGVSKVYVSEKVSCETKKLSDGSGIKILCNGDSIGTVWNGRDGNDGVDGMDGRDGKDGAKGAAGKDGKDGTDGEDGTDGQDGADGDDGAKGEPGDKGADGKDGEDGVDGVGCTIADATDTTVTIVCGNQSVTLDLQARMATDSIIVYAQKGPMVEGAKACILGEACSLIPMDDKGRFSFPTAKFTSQYASFLVQGDYLNEVTGELRYGNSYYDKLLAMVDIKKNKTVYVNALTTLDYSRTRWLMSKENMSVEQAKKQAHGEILNYFHVDDTDIFDFEQMNIFGSSESDAVLLAVSILLLRDSASVRRLIYEDYNFIPNYLNNGKGNNDSVRAEIASWAMNADLSGRLPKIRNNILNWKMSKTVPNFEKYVRNFWMKEFNVDDCSGANEGDIFVFPNEDASVRSLKCSAGEWTFHEIRDLRDSNIYRVVKIGNQIWMAENLNYEVDSNYHCYMDSCEKYRKLYTWATAMDSVAAFGDNGKGCGFGEVCSPVSPVRGICPKDWHLPDSVEWEALYEAVGYSAYALQAEGFERWKGAKDEFGFSAHPAPFYCKDRFVGYASDFWTTAQRDSAFIYHWYVYADIAGADKWVSKSCYLSVRCVKD